MKKIFSLMLPAILLTASIGYSQCFPDRHSTNFFDGWVSCETAVNPNPDRPESHFILYDFGKTYSLGQMQIWNSNDPSHLDRGIKDVAIDYSVDSITWLHAGNFTFNMASGLSTYEGEQGPDLGGIEAQYLLLTGLSNYGGICYGLSELKVEGTEVIVSDIEDILFDCATLTIYPNPFTDRFTLSISPQCEGPFRYMIVDGLGREILSASIELSAGTSSSINIGNELSPGAYILYIEFGGQSIQKNIIKVDR